MKYISFKTGICLAIIGMMFILFYYYTPWLFDDYWFAKSYIRHNGGSSSFSLTALYEFARDTREWDNGRLANILAPLPTLMMPHWLFAAVAGSMCAVLVYLLVRCAGVGKYQMPLAVCGTALASLVCLAWRDSMFVADFFLNYVLTSVLVLWLLLILNRVVYRNTLSTLQIVAVCVLAFIVAWMHEGFSIPVCFGLGLYALVRKFRLSWQWYVIGVFFIFGTLWVISAPGMWIRVDSAVTLHYDHVGFVKRIVQFTPLLLPLFLAFIIISTRYRGRRKLRVLLFRTPFVSYVGAAMTSAVIAFFLCPWLRVAWPAEMFMIIMVLMLGKDILQNFTDRAANMLYVVSLLLFVAIMSYALSWQKKFYKENEEIVAEMERGNGTVYRDLLVDSLTRWSVLYLPTYNPYINNFQYLGLSNWYGKPCAVVPAEMKDFDVAELVPFEGSLPVEGTINMWRSYMIAPPDSCHHASGIIENGEMYLRVNFTDPQGVLRSYLRKI